MNRGNLAIAEQPSRTLVILGASLFSLVLFLLGDLAYSAVVSRLPVGDPGTGSTEFDHTFVPNFSGHRKWGPIRYYFATDSLGFADRSRRVVPLQTSAYRVLFLGDSFTEGVGVVY